VLLFHLQKIAIFASIPQGMTFAFINDPNSCIFGPANL